MGKLRTEPKVKPLLSEKEYNTYHGIIKNAQAAAEEHHVFYDLENGENAAKARKALLYVAEQENIPVKIRRARNAPNSLSFSFKAGPRTGNQRMSKSEAQKLILDTLAKAERPMQKATILSQTGISPSTWNIRIKELMEMGKVKRHGERRETKYSLKK